MCQIKKSHYMPVVAAQTDDLRGESLSKRGRRRFVVINHGIGEEMAEKRKGKESPDNATDSLPRSSVAPYCVLYCRDAFGRSLMAIEKCGPLVAKKSESQNFRGRAGAASATHAS